MADRDFQHAGHGGKERPEVVLVEVVPGIHAEAGLARSLRRIGDLYPLPRATLARRFGESVWRQTGEDPRYEPTAYQRELVRARRLGRKTGHGVFRYDESGTAVDATPDEELAARLVGGPVVTDPVARTLAMLVNEGVDLVARCEASVEDVDTAMRLGTNYPKGPFEWLTDIGAETVRAQLAELDRAYPGGRYRPSEAL